MIVMPANHSSPTIHWLAGKYPNALGWLVGPTTAPKTKLRPWMPYALDNDAFSAWSKQRPWDVGAWREMLQWADAADQPPLWCLVPDVVTDKKATLAKWYEYRDEVSAFGWPKAFAVQDTMRAEDVPSDAEVVFVGGTAKWKWATVEMWCELFPRVHVGRVNSVEKLDRCLKLGAESVDGTGWFRDESDLRKIPALINWIEKNHLALAA